MEKSLADIHEELEEHMLAQGRLFLAQYDKSTLSSLREFDEYMQDEEFTADLAKEHRLVGIAIEDALAERREGT